MKSNNILSAAFTFMIILFMTACGKYDEGPVLSFVTKKERISNIWKVNYVEDNGPGEPGYPVTLALFDQNNVIVTIDKSGRSKVSITGDNPETVVYEGDWSFTNKNENIQWLWKEEIPGFVAIFNQTPVYRIRMLREDQLHLTSEDGRFRLHLSPL